DAEQVVQDPGDLREDHPYVLRSRWRRNPHQFFYGERERMLLAHWRYVVEPVEVRDRLQIRLMFDEFLGPAMQQADMRISAFNDLAVHLEDEPHHAVRRRMLRAEIHHEVSDPRRPFELFGGLLPTLIAHRPSCPSGSPPLGLAFSSPGRILSIPSQGDKKSKLRNSCCRRTGS